jgi:hypothetical protein
LTTKYDPECETPAGETGFRAKHTKSCDRIIAQLNAMNQCTDGDLGSWRNCDGSPPKVIEYRPIDANDLAKEKVIKHREGYCDTDTPTIFVLSTNAARDENSADGQSWARIGIKNSQGITTLIA